MCILQAVMLYGKVLLYLMEKPVYLSLENSGHYLQKYQVKMDKMDKMAHKVLPDHKDLQEIEVLLETQAQH